MKISILGAGSWGIAQGALLGKKGFEVVIWDKFEDRIKFLVEHDEDPAHLPGVKLPKEVLHFTPSLDEALNSSAIIVIAVPSQFVKDLAAKLNSRITKHQVVVITSKGIDTDYKLRLSEILHRLASIPHDQIVVLSGPSHAEEVIRNMPTSVVSASVDPDNAKFIQEVYTTPNFRVYTNSDVIGVELGGALKNIIAILAGISDGLGYGDNTKAAIISRGLSEIARLGTAMGANPFTFMGLSGMGDLVVTCTSKHSRNRRFGEYLGSGLSVEEAFSKMTMVVEGVPTTEAAVELSSKHGVQMPLTNQLYQILFKEKPVAQAFSEILLRDLKEESDFKLPLLDKVE